MAASNYTPRKKQLLVVCCLFFFLLTIKSYSQNVGIGTTNPVARLHVEDSNVVFTGPLNLPANPGLPAISGPGTRLLWYPDKAAFRIGRVSGTHWDKNNIGLHSLAVGFNTSASGDFSIAMGQGSIASAVYSTAIGINTMASGNFSTAMNHSTTASGDVSVAIGFAVTASGDYSTAMGAGSIASAYTSTAMGYSTKASGEYSTTIGKETFAKAVGSLTIGTYNDSSDAPTGVSLNTDRLFQIGNGTSVQRSNAITVLRNGNTGIGITNPGFPLNFASTIGEKISLFGNAGAHYGFGIDNFLMQIYTDASSSSIGFGYGQNSAFTENMRITGSGNLHVRNSIFANSSFYTSDSRYKKNIHPITEALERITQLQGYHYYWKDGQDASLQSGVIAQEVQIIFPELVQTDNKGFLSVNYVGLIPYLIQSIKEQQEQISKLNKENERLNKLETEISELKIIVEKLSSNKL